MMVVTALAGGCARQATEVKPTVALRPVVFQSDWFPQAEHGGFYQALVKGYYREAGLDVEILPGGPGTAIKLSVAKGMADFGMYRSDDVIVSASRGLPLVIVAAVLQHDPEALLVHAASPVKTLADLEGRSVIAPPSMSWIPYVKQKYRVKFDLRPLTYGLAAFLGDSTAIQQCMLTSEPYFAEQHGAKVRAIPLSDSGYDPYHTLICRRALIRTNPELVKAFVAASIRGWRDYLEGDPAEAHALILRRNHQMTAGQLEFSRQALIAHALVTGDAAQGEHIGRISLKRIQQQIDVLTEFKILEVPVTAASVASRAFLPTAAR
ncbi:MAG: NitT/TauT family transport system substrate-binding protein [Verrucomicrobia bacterium]|nr:MAG: NitT/TauT family transport system substrate-binding protein [Verrucomicrobiota bacterium]